MDLVRLNPKITKKPFKTIEEKTTNISFSQFEFRYVWWFTNGEDINTKKDFNKKNKLNPITYHHWFEDNQINKLHTVFLLNLHKFNCISYIFPFPSLNEWLFICAKMIMCSTPASWEKGSKKEVKGNWDCLYVKFEYKSNVKE